MKNNPDIINLGITFLAGVLPAARKYLQGKLKSMKRIMAELIVVFSVVFFFVPFIVEYFELSQKTGYVVAWVLSRFFSEIEKATGKKATEKIENL